MSGVLNADEGLSFPGVLQDVHGGLIHLVSGLHLLLLMHAEVTDAKQRISCAQRPGASASTKRAFHARGCKFHKAGPCGTNRKARAHRAAAGCPLLQGPEDPKGQAE